VDTRQHLELVAARKQGASSEHFGEQDADGKDVASRIDLGADHLLGRHVTELSLELTRVGAPIERDTANDAEVCELDLAHATDEDVAGRNVAVHEAERPAMFVGRQVRVREPAEHVAGDENRERYRKARSFAGNVAEQARERYAVHVLHGHEELALALAEIDHLDDVRVLKPGTDASLVDEHGDEALVLREVRQNALDGEALGKAVGPRAAPHEHLRHATETEPLPEDVRPEPERCGSWLHHDSEV
jgi:hypothetical protein